jgi:hypothetical protein
MRYYARASYSRYGDGNYVKERCKSDEYLEALRVFTFLIAITSAIAVILSFAIKKYSN